MFLGLLAIIALCVFNMVLNGMGGGTDDDYDL
jgi:hypothetical protein